MICKNKNNGQILVRFGSGDIGVSSKIVDITSGDSDSKVTSGVITFKDVEPQEIGSRVLGGGGDFLTQLEECPVVLAFSRVESVDVMVKHLTAIKECMVKNGIGI